jgi:GT2 family glycosyltransferase
MEAEPGARVATTGVHIRYQGSDTPRIPVSQRLTYDGFLDDRMTEVHPSATLVARSLIDEIGEVDERIPGGYAEDYDWLMRAAQVSPIAVAPQPLVRVHWHGGSFFFERWKTIDEALQYLVDKHPRFALHPKGLARVRGQQAVARAAMGDRSGALSAAWDAFRLWPTERRVPVAVLVAAGVPAGLVLKTLHRFGKGI